MVVGRHVSPSAGEVRRVAARRRPRAGRRRERAMAGNALRDPSTTGRVRAPSSGAQRAHRRDREAEPPMMAFTFARALAPTIVRSERPRRRVLSGLRREDLRVEGVPIAPSSRPLENTSRPQAASRDPRSARVAGERRGRGMVRALQVMRQFDGLFDDERPRVGKPAHDRGARVRCARVRGHRHRGAEATGVATLAGREQGATAGCLFKIVSTLTAPCTQPSVRSLDGNRGVLDDASKRIVRPWRLRRWIMRAQFKDRRREVSPRNGGPSSFSWTR